MVTAAPDVDAIGVIELELVKLVRHLETFGRRRSLYQQVDRAGYLALRTLEGIGPVSTKVLARALHLDASTVTRQVTTLEEEGLVDRRPDPADGRSMSLVTRPEGRRAMRAVEREQRRMESLLRDWDETGRARPGARAGQTQRLPGGQRARAGLTTPRFAGPSVGIGPHTGG